MEPSPLSDGNNAVVARMEELGVPASMEPSPLSDGNLRADELPAASQDASMEPSPLSDGNGTRGFALLPADLQDQFRAVAPRMGRRAGGGDENIASREQLFGCQEAF